MMRLETHIRII